MGNWPPMVWSDVGEQLIATRVTRATTDELKAVAHAWAATDGLWREAIFSPDAVEALDFWTHFSGKADRVGMVEIGKRLPEMIGSALAQTLIGYLSAIDLALWVGADITAIPDPWSAAGLPGLNSEIAHTISRFMAEYRERPS